MLSILGFTCANILNYYLGKHGYYKLLVMLGGDKNMKKVQTDFNKNQFKTVFLSAFHPNFLAITMVSAGIAKSNIIKVTLQSIVSLVFWVFLWMFLVTIFFKDSKIELSENDNLGYYFILIIFLWGLVKCLINNYRMKTL